MSVKQLRRTPASIEIGFKILRLSIALFFILDIPFTLAGNTPEPLKSRDQSQPTIQANAPATTSQNAHSASEQSQAGDSIFFLTEHSTLSKGPTPSGIEIEASALPFTPDTASTAQLPAPELNTLMDDKKNEVAMLVSEQCSQDEKSSEGILTCTRVYSNGNHAKVLSQSVHEGDEFKQQTIIEEFNSEGALLYKKTIRHRVDYNYLNDQKTKEKDLFDIIYQPVGKKTTRELMVYQYFLDTGKTKSLSWTQYKQIGDKTRAGLAYHTLLQFAEDGSPERGLAEKWNHGQKAATFMDWSRPSNGDASLNRSEWNQWEGWIRNVSLQAYLP